jgi:hypothetical protein
VVAIVALVLEALALLLDANALAALAISDTSASSSLD